MNGFKHKPGILGIVFISVITMLMVFISGCSQRTLLSSEITYPSETRNMILATATSSATIPNTQTATQATATPTLTKTRPLTYPGNPTKTPIIALDLQMVTPAQISTNIPTPPGPIGLDNFKNLSLVAEWGRGSILGTVFNPDGHTFVVGSAYGFAVYDLEAPSTPPTWVKFEEPFFYESIEFSSEGSYLLLKNLEAFRIANFSNGSYTTGDNEIIWLPNVSLMREDNLLNSQDEKFQFHSESSFDEEYWNIGLSDRWITSIDTDTKTILSDSTMYVDYQDRREVMGCGGIDIFVPCGNAFDPVAMFPYSSAFSSDNRTLSILYRPRDLGNTNRYSILHLYRVSDGNLLLNIGSFEDLIQTFSYSPDGSYLLVGKVNGSIEVWDIEKEALLYSAWHFNSPAHQVQYSFDGKYLVIQRNGRVEVRNGKDGVLLHRYNADSFALSPVENILALGEESGFLRVEDLETSTTRFAFQAHDNKIYAIAFAEDGMNMTTSGKDCAVRVWNTSDGQFSHYLARNTTNAEMVYNAGIQIRYLTYVPGGNQILGFGSWGRVVNWDASSGSTNYLIEPEESYFSNGMMTVQPNYPSYLYIDPLENVFYLEWEKYDLLTGEWIGEYTPPEFLPDFCWDSQLFSTDRNLAFSPGYEVLYNTKLVPSPGNGSLYNRSYDPISERGFVCILDAIDKHLLDVIEVFPPWPQDVLLSPDGQQLAVIMDDGLIKIYQVVE